MFQYLSHVCRCRTFSSHPVCRSPTPSPRPLDCILAGGCADYERQPEEDTQGSRSMSALPWPLRLSKSQTLSSPVSTCEQRTSSLAHATTACSALFDSCSVPAQNVRRPYEQAGSISTYPVQHQTSSSNGHSCPICYPRDYNLPVAYSCGMSEWMKPALPKLPFSWSTGAGGAERVSVIF